MINFGEWLPDQPDYNNAGVTVAENVIPALGGYRSLNDFVAYSNAATGTILNVFAAKEDDGTVQLFAGDATKLYKFNAGTNNLDDVSKAGGYDLTGAERWEFVQFGNKVIATGGTGEEPQVWTLGTSTAFANLAGSPPKRSMLSCTHSSAVIMSSRPFTPEVAYSSPRWLRSRKPRTPRR